VTATRLLLRVVAAATAALLAAGCTTMDRDPENPSISSHAPEPGSGNSLTRPQRDALSPHLYVAIAEDVRATDRAERFNRYLATAWETIQEVGNLSPEEVDALYMPDLEKPRSEWTDQDYVNYGTLATWLVTTQQDTEEALRALSVVYNKDRMPESWELLSDWIAEHPGTGYKAVYKVVPSRYSDNELRNVTVGPVLIGPKGGRFVQQRSLSSDQRATSFTLYKNFQDADGNVISIKEGNYTDLNDPDLRNIIK
jgi:hypothetical protein